MKRLYLAFLRGVAATALAKTGVVLVTSTVISFLFFELLHLAGVVTNQYVGLVLYLAFPALFIIGLLLIPIGLARYRKKRDMSWRELARERFDEEQTKARGLGSGVFRAVALLTLANIIFLTVLGMRTLHYMDQPVFCGTACHSVMGPEWATYQESPHARVKCVECHVGEGFDALIDSKLNGLYQVLSVTFNLYEKPIPTPVHQLRPARETCEKCHWPEYFFGNITRHIVQYDTDSLNTPSYTTLLMKIGAGREQLSQGSHWHVAERNTVRYASVHDEREEMIWVEVLQEDGSWKRYENEDLSAEHAGEEETVRVMDCVDCHNRATHIYEEPERAINERMRVDAIPRDLPYAKKASMEALMGSYGPDKEQALQQLETGFRGFYRRQHPQLLTTHGPQIDQAAASLRGIYERNIHPSMNIDWGAYPSMLGHRNDSGCFRCHAGGLVTSEGEELPYDCSLCHAILAWDEDLPYKYILEVPEEELKEPSSEMHEFLKAEYEREMMP